MINMRFLCIKPRLIDFFIFFYSSGSWAVHSPSPIFQEMEKSFYEKSEEETRWISIAADDNTDNDDYVNDDDFLPMLQDMRRRFR